MFLYIATYVPQVILCKANKQKYWIIDTQKFNKFNSMTDS